MDGNRPTRAGYWVSAIVLAAAVVTWFTCLVLVMTIALKSKQVYKGPTREEVFFDKAGRYNIFHEYVTRYEGVNYRNCKDIYIKYEIAITDEDGDSIEVVPAGHSSTYSFGESRKGFLVYYVRIPHPGRYTLAIEGEEGASGPVFFSVGRSLLGRVLVSLLIMNCVSPLMGAGAVAIFAVTFYRRYKYVKRTAEGAHGGVLSTDQGE